MTLLLGLLSYIPGLMSLVSSITTAAFNAKVQMYQARTGASRDVAIQVLQAQVADNQTKVGWLKVIASSPVLLVIVFGFAAPFIIFEWKCVVYDIVWMHGTTMTDPIRGQIADWATTIIGGIFVTSTGIGVAHAIISKNEN